VSGNRSPLPAPRSPLANMEFALIAKYFTRATPDAVLGVGDDCALLAPTPGMQLAVSSDMLLEGRHFSPQDSPAASATSRWR